MQSQNIQANGVSGNQAMLLRAQEPIRYHEESFIVIVYSAVYTELYHSYLKPRKGIESDSWVVFFSGFTILTAYFTFQNSKVIVSFESRVRPERKKKGEGAVYLSSAVSHNP